MSVSDELIACAGRWSGQSTLRDPGVLETEASTSTALITPVLDKHFVRFDYSWSYQGKSHEGSLLIGGDPKTRRVSAYFADTFHMGHSVMTLTGTADERGAVSVRGSYSVPDSPDWGWRIDLVPGPDDLRLVMYNIFPDGREELAVEALYRRA